VQDFAGLEHLLESSQVAANLLAGFFSEQLRECGSDWASGRLVAELDSHLGAASARRG
jgi:hypothetical protein